MVTDLAHRFKDRDPAETVQIIKDFFESNGLVVTEQLQKKSSVGTYWCGLTLHLDGKFICRSNGKGTAPEYALASGYSELYERYCAGYGSYSADFAYNYYFCQLNKEKYGYFYDADEKFMPFEEIRESCYKFQEYFKIIHDEENYVLKTYNLNFQNHINNVNLDEMSLVVPYKSFDIDGKVKYFNQAIIENIQGSSGLAAGNSLEEALTQGLSECYEHYAIDLLYREKDKCFYELNLNSIRLPENITKIIQNIINQNYYIHIYDLSYSFGVPVILTIMIDKSNHTWYMNLGSSPIIEIAIERTLTEMYQGVNNLNEENLFKFHMYPGKDITHLEIMQNTPSCVQESPIYPEHLLLNKVLVNDYNKDVFLGSKSYTNIELNNHLKKINQNKNFNVYYRNLSLIDNMYAIQIFIDNIEIYDASNIGDGNWNNTADLLSYYQLNYILIKKYIDFIFNNKGINISEIIEINNQRDYLEYKLNYNGSPGSIITHTKFGYIFLPVLDLEQFYEQFKNGLLKSDDKISNIAKEKLIYYYYLFLYQSYSGTPYTINEIVSIFKNLGYKDIKTLKEDYEKMNSFNLSFLFEKIVINSYKEELNQDYLNKLLMPFLKKQEGN